MLDENWDLRLIAISSDSSTNSMVDYDFTISLRDGCLLDKLSEPSNINGLDYYIAVTGLYEILTPTFTRLVENCAIGWSLV